MASLEAFGSIKPFINLQSLTNKTREKRKKTRTVQSGLVPTNDVALVLGAAERVLGLLGGRVVGEVVDDLAGVFFGLVGGVGVLQVGLLNNSDE